MLEGETPVARCRVLRLDGACYAYDAGTNALLEIDPVLADVLPLWGPLEADGVVERLRNRHAPPAVLAAIAEIETARAEEGLFAKERRPAPRPCPSCRSAAAYENGLRHLTLTLSEQCNLRCRYCLHGSGRSWVRPHRERAMPLETALAAVRYFAAHCRDAEAPAVSFYGGEPLLRLDLIQAVVAEARRHRDWPRLEFCVDTNGTLLDDEAVAFIAGEGLRLQVSLDGPPAVHDRHRRFRDGGPTHAVVMDGLARLLDRSPEAAARLSVVVTLAPPYDLDSVMAFFADQAPWHDCDPAVRPTLIVNFADVAGVDRAQLGLPETEHTVAESAARCAALARRRYLQARLDGRGEGIDPVLAALCDRPLVRLHRRRRGRPDAAVPLLGCCLPGQRRLHVRVDGTLQPCERVGDSLVIGRLPDGIDLGLARALDERLLAALGSRCRDCWAVRLCDLCYTVLAPLEPAAGERTPVVPDEVCVATRARIEEDLRLYLRLLRGGEAPARFLRQAVLA